MTIQITIIGLNALGTSLGMALGSSKDQIVRVGSDAEPEVLRKAQKVGVIDKGVFNLPEAVRGADAVVLCVPVSELRHTFETIRQDLKPGVVVLDTSHSPKLSAGLAEELLPEGDCYFLGFTPALNPQYLYENPAAAHADAFSKGSIFLSHNPNIDASAIEFASNLATLLGAKPVFSELVEVEGLLALIHWAPVLAAAAVQGAVMEQPGWKEARRLAGSDFIQAGMPLEAFPREKDAAEGLVPVRENALRMIDLLSSELERLRTLVLESSPEELAGRLELLRELRSRWLEQRNKADWESPDVVQPKVPGVGERLGQLFGLRPRKKN